ncbi:hypothetical protein RYX36_006682, partial [Vicia faba]
TSPVFLSTIFSVYQSPMNTCMVKPSKLLTCFQWGALMVVEMRKISTLILGGFGKGALMIFGLTIYSLLGLGVVVEFLRNDSLSITSSSDSDTGSER